MTHSNRLRNTISLAFGIVLALAGCDEPTKPPASKYLPQTSPENVLANLQAAYRDRDIEGYIALMAEDFVFEFDPGDIDPDTQPDGVWHLEQDSISTRNMFNNENLWDESYRVLEIRINLTYGSAVAASEPERAGQRYILVTKVALDVDTKGDELGTVTYRIPGDQADFYFRRGRAPEDSTSSSWYIVGWRDRPQSLGIAVTVATSGVARSIGSPNEPSVERPSWGKIKALYYRTSPPAAPF